ncbi:DUF1963 domain-containing protein [Streptomyces sp. NPDC004250]|uniref:DUF1963 domain-containing protein n=1 Tax=Streptomyces sp. NPDC004250 TaxID=3364692 RepID=UPI003673AAEF
MDSRILNRLAPFREEALKRGIPAQDVERWIATARPTATLVTSGDGPLAGRFGGPLMLPPDAPDPWYPLLATLDCAALTAGVAGLQLPPDGHMLLFGFPFPDGHGGEARYIPAGTPVEERRPAGAALYHDTSDGEVKEDTEILELYAQFPQDELQVSADVCLPSHFVTRSPDSPYVDAPLPSHPLAFKLTEAWACVSGEIMADGPLQIGGYASHECTETDPVMDAAGQAQTARQERVTAGCAQPADAEELPAPEHWTLLAQWDVGGLRGREGYTLHWVIPKQDLADRRFDRVYGTGFWNP